MPESPSQSRLLGHPTILSFALLRKVGALLQLRAGEGPLAVLLLAQSFLSGMSIALTNTAGMALFMEQHGSTKLPLVYVAASILIRRPVVVLDDGSVSQGFTDNGFKKLFGVG